jgi:hypothetical protein
VSCSEKSRPAPTAAKPPATTPPAVPAELAFDIVDGDIHNHFYRRGPIAAHVLASSGAEPRLIVAFPAGNTGIALWFDKPAAPVKLDVDGPLSGVERDDGMRGISMTLVSTAERLEVRAAVLGSIRTIRDFVYLQKAPPETAHDVKAGPPVVMRRTTVDGTHHVELVLEPEAGTTALIDNGKLVLVAPRGSSIRVRATALQDDEPLTPLHVDKILTVAPPQGDRDLRALAFLSYREKLLAGSWRFLTYFGRDTLLSLRMLLPVLQPEVTEAALGSVLERLAPDGDVAHEEDIGDFAALRRKQETPDAKDLRAPLYDYKMIDDDFLLAPVVAAYLLDTDAGKARAKDFLARKTSGGTTYADALERNIELVVKRAMPFAAKPSASALVALKPGLPVGQWRDSEQGLGNGRAAFDVNVALVPAALDAAARLYESGLFGTKDGAKLRKLANAWQAAEKYFRVTLPLAVATARVKDYAASLGLDAKDALASLTGPLSFHAISLDANGRPIPVMHTDDGFVLMFGTPTPQYLEQVAGQLQRPFPAGLRTPVGIVVANAFAGDAKLRELFARGNYHGALVWSWQQALLVAGLDRQLARTDLPAKTKAALEAAERAVWQAIDATAEQRTGELWTWDVKAGRIELVPFGQQGGHADESNAVQLWSTVYLGVRKPARVTTPK